MHIAGSGAIGISVKRVVRYRWRGALAMLVERGLHFSSSTGHEDTDRGAQRQRALLVRKRLEAERSRLIGRL
jgi:hypothetical protein